LNLGRKSQFGSNNNIDTLKAIVDTVKSSSGSDSDWIMHHVMDGKEIELPFLGYVHILSFLMFLE